MGNGLEAVLQRIERAKEQRGDLEIEMRSWADAGAYGIGTHLDAETGQTLFYLGRLDEVTAKTAALVGEIAHSLRTALDHLAYQLFLICRTDLSDEGSRVEFPIYDDAKTTESNAFRPIKALRKEMIEAIRAVKPYKTGNPTLWILHRLDIVDKHRRILTGVLSHHSIYISGAMRELLKTRGYGDMEGLVNPTLFKTTSRTGQKAKVGDVLFKGMPGDEEVNKKLQFTFDITFDEPGIIEGKSVIETLDEMLKVVENLILSFEPFLI